MIVDLNGIAGYQANQSSSLPLRKISEVWMSAISFETEQPVNRAGLTERPNQLSSTETMRVISSVLKPITAALRTPGKTATS